MRSNKQMWHLGLAAMTCVGLTCLAPACSEDFDEHADEQLRAGEGDAASEEPEPDPSPGGVQIEVTPDAGVEGPLTINAGGVAELLAQGSVGADLEAQMQAAYVGPSVANQGKAKVEAVTGEPIEQLSQVDGEFVGQTASYSFRIAEGAEQLYIHHRWRVFSDVPPHAAVSEGVIAQQAGQDLALLGIPLPAKQQLRVDRLMRASSKAPGQPEAVAYKVFVGLELAGTPVVGPRLVLSYYLDGTLHKVAGHWPQIDAAAGPPAPPPMPLVRDLVFSALKTHPLGAETHPRRAAAELSVVAGQLRHSVRVSGLLDNGMGGGRIGELEVLLPPLGG